MKSLRWQLVALLSVGLMVSVWGCVGATGGGGSGPADQGDDVDNGDNNGDDGGGDVGAPAEVNAKAVDVAEQIGSGGFGGAALEGYEVAVDEEATFDSEDDLAPDGATIRVRFQNQAQQQCTFQFRYVASHLGVDENTEEVTVDAGDEVELELPCSEIIGLGPLESPGEPGCQLADGQAVANTMAVPGFLGADFACGEMHQYRLTPDTDDLDEDGDTEELICTSGAFERHMHQHQHQHGEGGNGSDGGGGEGPGGDGGEGPGGDGGNGDGGDGAGGGGTGGSAGG